MSRQFKKHGRLGRFVKTLLPKSDFLRNVGLVAGGNIVAQSINALTVPSLTRLYTPEAFGLFAVFFSIYGTVSVVACLRYETAIMIPDDDHEASSVLWAAIVICVWVSLAVGILAWTLLPIACAPWSVADSLTWKFVLPLIVFLSGAHAAVIQWYSRRKRYVELAVSFIVVAGAIAVIKIALPWIAPNNESNLIIGQCVGQGSATLLLTLHLLWFDRHILLSQDRTQHSYRKVLAKYKDFCLYSAPQVLFNRLGGLIVLPILGAYQSPHTVGVFALAKSTIELPSRPITNALDQVFYQQAARQKQPYQIENILIKSLYGLSLLFVPVIVFVTCHVEAAVDFAFGPRWGESSHYLQILIYPSFALFLTSWNVRVFDIQQRQRLAMVMEGTYLIISVGLFWAALSCFRNPLIAVAVYSAVGVLYYSSRAAVLFSICGLSLRRLAKCGGLICSQFALWAVANKLASHDQSAGLILLGAATLIYYALLAVGFWRYGPGIVILSIRQSTRNPSERASID